VIRTHAFARRGAAALIVAACAAAVSVPAALGQATAEVSVNPSSGPPGSQFTITLKNYRACAADSPNCIVIDFVQSGTVTRIGTADSKGSATFTGGPLTVPPAAKAGSATIHAHSTLDDASTGFTVTSAAATTTSSTSTSTSTSTSAVSTTSTTVGVTTTVSTVVLTTTSTTAVPIKTKKSSSHSDVPRYIAVILVVLAAGATAAVDTRLRRLRG
jgi:hypothetical protein